MESVDLLLAGTALLLCEDGRSNDGGDRPADGEERQLEFAEEDRGREAEEALEECLNKGERDE